MGKVPLQVLKKLEHQARQNLSIINFTATFAKTASSCNIIMEKCQHSIKATFKRVKSQIQKGADPERAARRSYEHACDYLEIMNKRILSMPQQICIPYPPERALYHGQHWPANTRG